jgi:hypothetical protein
MAAGTEKSGGIKSPGFLLLKKYEVALQVALFQIYFTFLTTFRVEYGCKN